MIDRFIRELHVLTVEGGWVFWCLVALGFGIAFSLVSIWYYLRLPNAPILERGEWLRLIGAEQSPNMIAKLKGGLGGDGVERRLDEIGERLFATLRRRIPFAFVLIGAAPLVGLLGTVSGMFTTFDGMASAVAVAPVDVISKGVSEALITTQTGLIISVPTFIACSMLQGRYRELRNGFERLESAVLQNSTGLVKA